MADSRLFSEFEPSSGSLQQDPQPPEHPHRATDQPYAVIRRYTGLDPHSIEEVTRQVNEDLVPILSQLPGFVAYYALHTGADVVASISIFEDQAGADESTTKTAVWVKQHLASLVPNPPQFTAGNVIASKVKEVEGRSAEESSRP